MADDEDIDDQWLYGERQDAPKLDNQQETEPSEKTPIIETKENGIDNNLQPMDDDADKAEQDTEEKDETEQEEINKENDQDDKNNKEDQEDEVDGQQNGDDEDLDDDDSDDDVNVVIGDIKSTPSYTSMNIKRGTNLLPATQTDKSKQQQQSGKFSVDEFEQVGMINGVPATEYNLDSLEDKPWRKPGADITDYFNYGFNEDTWRAYCERQKRMRVNESGVGLAAQINPLARAGPPPGRRMTGSIDVIGGTTTRITPAPMGKPDAPKMNVIQVMTADRREYSRKPTGFPDLTVPPPTFEDFQPEYGFNPEPEPFYGGYEPTQDSQWGPDGSAPPPNWQPGDIKSLTPGPVPGPGPGPVPPHNMGPPMPIPAPSPRTKESPPRAHSRERERSREVSRARSERRDRERSHRRERSRSRSRRHRTRSRSPSHRSHKKKKSRRHDDSE